MRINKFLASAGIGARRKVEGLIISGKVEVNCVKIENLATEINPQKDFVKVNGKIVSIEKRIYIIFNKPKGILTAVSDDRGRKSVRDLLNVDERIFPMGRLDRNSHGLLILTNDGDLAAKLLHPRFKIPKVYEVRANSTLGEKELAEFRQGIEIEGKKTALAKIKELPIKVGAKQKVYEVVLKEGRKRQIRKMFEALGYKVTDLKRTQFGPIKLLGLKEGQWRELTKQELTNLGKAAAIY
ncbi:MAG: rRNA pseudouridine synthase [Actinobacteria bacterium]|nr:MAG: rRNA pseudouridine synthase [Actinomycetota bacterium]